jgi:5'-nucleotidase/UDP-sugar diphosphatase
MMHHLTRRESLKILVATGAAALTRDAKAAGETVRLSFLLVNDFYRLGENDDRRGGFARLAAVVKAERARAQAEGRRFFFLHAGDTLSPSLLSSLDSGAHMITLFNELGLDAFAPGNHEFDFGKEIYLQRIGEARFPVIAANLRDAKGALLPHHQDQLLFDVGGLKIALIGCAFDETPGVSRPGDLVFAPTVETITATSQAAREKGANLVVALIHAGKAACGQLMSSHAADLILSGHNHDLHMDFDGKSGWMESAADADYLAAVDLDITLMAAQSASWRPSFRPLDTAQVTPDAEYAAKVAVHEARLEKALERDVATLAAPLDSRTEVVRSQEAAIGNLFADALRNRSGAEIALINGGGIRGNRTYSVGARLTRRTVVEELPFANKTIAADVSGKTLLAALENGFSQLGRSDGRFPQIAGLTVTIDRSAPPFDRIRSVLINGEKLDPARRYRLVTNDFLAQGGDGYLMLAGEIKAGADSGIRMVAEDVTAYLEQLKLVDAKVEGRLVFL